MVKRGRNHASIVVNSLCNEVECVNTPDVGQRYVALSKSMDPTRPTTANSNGNDGLDLVIDIQGFSHSPDAKFKTVHASNPKQPLVLSECCSCETQRSPRKFTDSCMRTENSPLELPFVAGSLGVWTLFDVRRGVGPCVGVVGVAVWPSSGLSNLSLNPRAVYRRAAGAVALRKLVFRAARPRGYAQAQRVLVCYQLAGASTQ